MSLLVHKYAVDKVSWSLAFSIIEISKQKRTLAIINLITVSIKKEHNFIVFIYIGSTQPQLFSLYNNIYKKILTIVMSEWIPGELLRSAREEI